MPSAQERGYERKTGLMPTLKRTFSEFKEDYLTDWAAALTYYGVLSLFPALLALVSVVGLVFNPQQIISALEKIVAQLGPSSAVETLKGPIESVASGGSSTGIALVTGLLAALFAASKYVGAFMRASNVIYEVDEGREFYKLRPLQMLITLVMILIIAIGAIAVVVSGPVAQAVGSAVGLGDTAVTIWSIAKWPVLVLLVMLVVSVLYYASPNAKLPGFKFISLGSVVAVLVWIIASALFAFYVANFGSYNKTFGSLAGVIIFLVWLWITNVAILFGHQLNAERLRDDQLKEGVEGADREIKLEERDEAKAKQRPTTA